MWQTATTRRALKSAASSAAAVVVMLESSKPGKAEARQLINMLGEMSASVAVVDQRNGEFYVQSWDYSTGRSPMLSQGIWYARIAEDLPAELGPAVRAALAHSPAGVEDTPERHEEKRKTRRALLKLAGVRAKTQYQTGLSSSLIKDNEESDDLEVVVYDNPDPRKNMTERPGRIYIARAIPDEELGARVRDLLGG